VSEAKAGPLTGIKVIDVAQMLAAPFAAMLLADFGATVVKIEPPLGDASRRAGHNIHGTSMWWRLMSRNKFALTANLKDARGQELVRRLIADADVLVDNMRPGKLEACGLDPVELRKTNPGLIVLRVTGWGQTGPYRDQPAFGSQAEALSGFTYSNGHPDGKPVLPANPLADAASGYLGAFSVMVALWARERDPEKRGQTIDLSLLESFFHMLGPWATAYTENGHIMGRLGGRSGVSAPRNIYRSKDDRWVAVSAATDVTAQRCFAAIGRKEMNRDPRFATLDARVENIDQVDAAVQAWIGAHDGAEGVKVLGEAGVPASLIYNIKDIMEDPHFKARELVVDAIAEDLGRTIKMQNVFPRLELTPGAIQWTGRAQGADNREWFVGKLGVSSEEFARLIADGVI
jgi:crotonobetainyl-CoA:carnitine CoA-transferase CaiB-like acyl-CoA transferase